MPICSTSRPRMRTTTRCCRSTGKGTCGSSRRRTGRRGRPTSIAPVSPTTSQSGNWCRPRTSPIRSRGTCRGVASSCSSTRATSRASARCSRAGRATAGTGSTGEAGARGHGRLPDLVADRRSRGHGVRHASVHGPGGHGPQLPVQHLLPRDARRGPYVEDRRRAAGDAAGDRRRARVTRARHDQPGPQRLSQGPGLRRARASGRSCT